MRSDVHSGRNLVILHNSPAPDPRHEKVAADIVRLTLGNGLDDKYLKPHVKAAMATVLTTFSGDWTGHAVTHRCCVPLCPGGKTCRQRTIDNLTVILTKVLFSHKVQIPAVSRWWKCTPIMRHILLGVSLHNLWPSAAPTVASRPACLVTTHVQDVEPCE